LVNASTTAKAGAGIVNCTNIVSHWVLDFIHLSFLKA